MTKTRVGTPCVGVCSTTYGDTVCRGCKRFLHEVVNWNSYDEQEKQIVWHRLDQLLSIVVENYLVVEDPSRLKSRMEYQNIRLQPQLSPSGWVPELLKAAGRQPLDWQDFGLRLQRQTPELTPGQLYERISQEFHALSCAHFQRNHGHLLVAGQTPETP